MKYTLIKTENNFVLVSDDEIKEDDYFLSPTDNKIWQVHSDSIPDFDLPPDCLVDGCKKAIASFNPLENICSLTFTDEVAKQIGYVDVKKKAEFSWHEGQEEFIPLHAAFLDAFSKGYNQHANDNKDKKYTEDDLRKAYEKGAFSSQYPSIDEFELEDYTKNSWQVTISHDESNNTILITKII